MSLDQLIKNSEAKKKIINQGYKGDIRRFKEWCDERNVADGTDSMLEYLYQSFYVDEVKKSTWERRYQSIRSHLDITYGVKIKHNQKVGEAITVMRQSFSDEGRESQNETTTHNKVNIMDILQKADSLEVRQKAIVLVNLVTASKPCEMVLVKVKDFDFDKREVKVFVRGRELIKILSLETTRAVRKYFRQYNLEPNDYFVGRTYKGGRYESRKVSEVAYRESIKKWVGFAPTVLKVTQISEMYEKGAGLLTIAKQSGHRDLASLIKHNIQVSNSEVEKYI